MPTVTIDIPEELSTRLAQVGDRLPDLVANALREPPLPAHAYRHVLDFLAADPTGEQIAALTPTPEMIDRLRLLIARQHSGDITPEESNELDEYERLEHLMVMIKSGDSRARREDRAA